MREIKFRAWVDGHMVYEGDFNNWEITLDGKVHFYQLCQGGEFGTDHYTLGKNIELLQYTGLKDKNGKEIYEGDRVVLQGHKPEKAIVKFGRGRIDASDYEAYSVPIWGFYLDNRQLEAEDDWGADLPEAICEYEGVLEVIGNIWEHKELLT